MDILERISNFIERAEGGISIALTGYDPWGLFEIAEKIPEAVEGFPPKPSDVMVIDTSGEDIGIDLVREVSSFLSFSPEFSRRKYVLMRDAEKMTLQAGNALLKTLEEPPSYGVIVLTTTMWNYLLPTIRSRLVRFNAPPIESGKDWFGLCREFDSRVEGEEKVREVQDAVNSILNYDSNPTRGCASLHFIIETIADSSPEDLVDILDGISSKISGKDFFRFLKILSKAVGIWMIKEKKYDLNSVRFFDSISRAKIANFNNTLTLYNIALRIRELIRWN